MKGWIWIPVALLLGLLVGALGPRSELRQSKAEMDRLRKVAAEREREKNRLQDVMKFLQVPDTAERRAGRRGRPGTRSERRPAEAAATNVSAGPVLAPASTNAETHFEITIGGPPPSSRRDREADRRSLRARIDEAADLWRTRSQIARASFVADAELDAGQAASFDVVVEAMNLRLKDRISYWAETIARTNAAGPETGVRMMNDLTGALVFTYDEMDRKLPAGWRGRIGGETSIMDFIDPSVAEPLIGVEGKLQGLRAGRRQPGEAVDGEADGEP